MASDIERILTKIDEVNKSVNENHTVVVQRLTALETNQHSPVDCPGMRRIEKSLVEHIKDSDLEKRDAGWKALIREVVRNAVAAIVAAITALGMRKF